MLQIVTKFYYKLQESVYYQKLRIFTVLGNS